jgi:hypothetical protein
MVTRRLLPVVAFGLAIATVSATTAEAQRRRATAVTVCRDGARYESASPRVCDRHRGVDARATEAARRYEADRVATGGPNGGQGRDPRYDPRYDDRNDRQARDPRFEGRDGQARDPRRDDRYDDRYDDRRDRGGYDGRYGTGRNEVYEWQGRVDKEIQIQLRGDRAAVQPIGAGEMRSGRGRVLNGLPRREGMLVVQRLEGRGHVDVIAQPTARNGYTATLRLRDPQGGAANYRIVAYWEPTGVDRYGYDDRRRDGY